MGQQGLVACAAGGEDGGGVHLGVDWLTLSKPRAFKAFKDDLMTIFKTFRTVGEARSRGHGYGNGFDLARYGVCVWRGCDILVELPGRAMEYIRGNLQMPDNEVCIWFHNLGFRATRIDVALDTTEAAFNPKVAFDCWRKGLVRCNAHSCEPIGLNVRPGAWDFLPADGKGMTTRIGSPGNERFMRIYDKVTEIREGTGQVLLDAHGKAIEHLTRIELQHRHHSADQVMGKIERNGIGVIREIIAGYIEFLSHRDGRDKRRKRIAAFWERIVGNRREFLQLIRGATTPKKSMRWMRKQVSSTAKMMKKHRPDEWTKWIEEIIPQCSPKTAVEAQWEADAEALAQRKEHNKECDKEEREDKILRAVDRQVSGMGRTVNVYIDGDLPGLALKIGRDKSRAPWSTSEPQPQQNKSVTDNQAESQSPDVAGGSSVGNGE